LLELPPVARSAFWQTHQANVLGRVQNEPSDFARAEWQETVAQAQETLGLVVDA